MSKRKQPEAENESEIAPTDTPSKRRRKAVDEDTERSPTNGLHTVDERGQHMQNGSPSKQDTPAKRARKPSAKVLQNAKGEDEGSPTPKVNGRTLFATPSKGKDKAVVVTPSRSVKAKADRSAKRKSARLLAEAQEEEDEDAFEGQDTRLAREILDGDEDEDDDAEDTVDLPDLEGLEADDAGATTPSKQTPTKRGRPRTRVPKPTRSPTPEGDVPPEERYFYQNRSGPAQVSNNRFNNVKLLTQDEYYEQISAQKDHHTPEKAFLQKLHARSFPQWKFELDEGYGLCLYGYGSKRSLVTKFAEWLYNMSPSAPPRIVIVNGYTPKLNIRAILNAISSALAETEDEEAVKLVGQPEEQLDTLLTYLTSNPPSSRLYIMINSIDSPSLRRPQTQSLLCRLAAHPSVNFLCTADTPTFALQWTSTHLDNFRFVYHDCTTFAPYTAEIPNVVDEVHELLGRKRLRAGGKDGVGFVLKSLPENARNLYRLLLTEILMLMDDGVAELAYEQDDLDIVSDHDMDMDIDQATPSKRTLKNATKPKPKTPEPMSTEDLAIPYRTLYRKATEEFICSSAMNFQFLLKEFLDHQMIFTKRDGGSKAEMLGVPLGREEIEGVLGELI